MIRKCTEADFATIHEIINDAAIAYKGVIPADRWHEPYMSIEELQEQIQAGVEFWGYEKDDKLVGVMGIQNKGEVTLIRHAYVRTAQRKQGIGGKLLGYLCTLNQEPVLIGTWADASWAIDFYEKNGFRLVTEAEKEELLRKYWSIPDRQVATSVVLADEKWKKLKDVI